MKTQKLPLFTYGALKPSLYKDQEGNFKDSYMLRNLIEGSLEGYVEKYELRDKGEYPIAIPNKTKKIFGSILWLDLQKYENF